MKLNIIKTGIGLGIIFLFFSSCEKDRVFEESDYYNTLSFTHESNTHPKKDKYQAALNELLLKGAVGASVTVRDSSGTWHGAGGFADIKSNVAMQPGHRFFIASISKVFTATCIFYYMENNQLELSDKVNKWIDKSITNEIANSNEATIAHLLSHRSGIPDYYTNRLEMDRVNVEYNNWRQEDVLKYVYGKKAEFSVNQSYAYSNTNYLLLGMILEKVSGKTLEEVYNLVIFDPLNLNSAVYSTDIDKMAEGTVKGYLEYYVNGKYVEAQNLYYDELCIGGDGGIAINSQELNIFMDKLMGGEIINETSLSEMTNWFDIEKHYDEQIHIKNGYGIEYFKTDFGTAYGHTGGVDGFISFLLHFPNEDITINALFNYDPYSEKQFKPMLEFVDEGMLEAIFK